MFRGVACLAILLLSLCAGFAPSAIAQEATPEREVSPFVVDPATCTVEPLSPEELQTLAASELVISAPAASPVAHDVPFAAPDGEPADPETTEAVTAVIRESWACLNAGDWARFFALLTEQEVRQNFAPQDITGLTAQPPAPAPPDQQTAVFAVLDVERLPDGRVGAFVVVDTAGDPLPVEINYQIAAETDDGWTLDDYICFSETGGLC